MFCSHGKKHLQFLQFQNCRTMVRRCRSQCNTRPSLECEGTAAAASFRLCRHKCNHIQDIHGRVDSIQCILKRDKTLATGAVEAAPSFVLETV